MSLLVLIGFVEYSLNAISSLKTQPNTQFGIQPSFWINVTECAGFDAPKCVKFCTHNIYGIINGKVVVVNPQNCIYGCIACEHVCPRKAIAFPNTYSC